MNNKHASEVHDAPALPANIPLNPVLRKQFGGYAEQYEQLNQMKRTLDSVVQGAAGAALAAMGIPEDAPYGIDLFDLDAGFVLKGAPEEVAPVGEVLEDRV